MPSVKPFLIRYLFRTLPCTRGLSYEEDRRIGRQVYRWIFSDGHRVLALREIESPGWVEYSECSRCIEIKDGASVRDRITTQTADDAKALAATYGVSVADVKSVVVYTGPGVAISDARVGLCHFAAVFSEIKQHFSAQSRKKTA